MRFTLRQLTYFSALVRERNFGRAAASCHVSQPALSVQIRALEELAGGALVERHARDVILTPLGRSVLAEAEEVLRAAETLERHLREAGQGARMLSLGFIPTLAPYLLPGTLAALRAGDLSLQIEVREARTETLLRHLRDGVIDAAVMALPVGDPSLHEIHLFDDRFLVAGNARHLERLRVSEGTLLQSEDLRSGQLLLLEEGHCLTDQALEVCGQDRGAGNIEMVASSLGTLSQLVAEGFGLTLMPELAARTECHSLSGLELRRFGAPEPKRQIGLVRRRQSQQPDWDAALAGILREVGQRMMRECPV